MSYSPYDEPPKEKTLPPIDDCHFCHSADDLLEITCGGELYYQIYCTNCEALGPAGHTAYDAIRLWNEATG